jgi:hypothetical protein
VHDLNYNQICYRVRQIGISFPVEQAKRTHVYGVTKTQVRSPQPAGIPTEQSTSLAQAIRTKRKAALHNL